MARTGNSNCIVLRIFAAVGLVSTAGAQTSWINPVNGTWGAAGNWTGGVPTATLDATLGHAAAYDVTMTGAGTSQSLTISDPLARLLINSGVSYAVVGNITNAGTIIVNPTGGAADAAISFNSPAITLSGTGTLVLCPTGGGFAQDAGLNTSVATNIVSNAAGHTIRGNGYINANVDNAGLITCDLSGKGLSLVTNPKSNSGEIVAQNGGVVGANITITQTGSGVIRATGAGSIAQFGPGAIVGGTWEGVSGGIAQTVGNTTLNGVTTNGTVNVNTGTSISVLSSLSNTGTITVNPSGGASDATISFDSPAITLAGGGTIVLNPIGGGVSQDAGINTNVASNVVTNPADATIRGNGYINANIANAGLITGDIPSRGINLLGNPKSSSGLILAQNGGFIDLNTITLTQTGAGVLRASGANAIAEASGSIIGGAWEGVLGGLARTGGNLTLDGVTTNGDVHVITGQHVSVLNSITNTGTITVNPSGGASDATISFDSPAITIAGGGTIVLCPTGGGFAQDAGINTSAGTNIVTNPSGATIRGNGYINANIDNAGLITCDLSGKGLSLVTNPKSNSGQIVAQNGGTVGANVTITQSGSGVYGATGAGSIAQHGPGAIIGGTWEGVSGGVARTTGNLTLDGVTLNGSVQLVTGHTISVTNGLTNNGELTINPSGGASNASLAIQAPAQTIGGTGSIVLNGVSSTNDANIAAAAGVTLTCGPDHTIAGRGQIIANTILQGTISPGTTAAPVNRIEHTSQTLTFTPSATLAVDVNGLAAGQFDVLACTGTGVALDGTLAVTVGVGFIPALGDEFVIMTHGPRTGTFEQIVTPNPGPNNAWRVRYEAARTVLTVTCPPDINGDHSVSLDDLTQLLSNFGIQSGAQGFQGDLDGDGDVDISDLAALLATFGSTCP